MLPFGFALVLFLTLSSLTLYTVNCGLNLFFQPRKGHHKYKKIGASALFLLVSVITYMAGFFPSVNLVIHFFMVLMLSEKMEGRMGQKCIASLLWVAFSVVCELAIGTIYSIVAKVSLNGIVTNEVSKFILAMLTALVMLMVVKAVQLYRHRWADGEPFSFLDSLQVGAIPLGSVFIMHTFMRLSEYDVSGTHWLLVGALVCLVLMNLFFFSLFDRLRKTERIRYENELLKNQWAYYEDLEQHMEATFQKVRVVKHDLKHHLFYLKERLQAPTAESLEEAERQITGLIGEVLGEEVQAYTKNEKLNRILNYKLFRGEKLGITAQVQVSLRAEAQIDESTLYPILGNAIDNALGALGAEGVSEKTLFLRIFEDQSNLVMKISNPYVGQLRFQNGLPVTTKKDKENHGLGLWSMKKLVEDKGGYFKINIEDQVFSLEIILFDEIGERG